MGGALNVERQPLRGSKLKPQSIRVRAPQTAAYGEFDIDYYCTSGCFTDPRPGRSLLHSDFVDSGALVVDLEFRRLRADLISRMKQAFGWGCSDSCVLVSRTGAAGSTMQPRRRRVPPSHPQDHRSCRTCVCVCVRVCACVCVCVLTRTESNNVSLY